MSLADLFQWLYHSSIGEAIRQSHWLFAVLEAIHLVGLGVLGGAVLVVDLSLFGLGLGRKPVAQLVKEAQPWLLGSLAVMFTTGIPLFLSEATKCFYNAAFWIKMAALFSIILFTFTVRRRVIGMTPPRPLLCSLTAIVSLSLWFLVAWGGRWIGFSS